MSQTDPCAVALIRFEMPQRECCTTTLQPDQQGQWVLYTDAVNALADAERREADRCAKDVCMYCGGRALGYSPVIGPNQSGHYIHATRKATGEDVLCRASWIYSRLRAQAQADKEG